MASEYLKYKYRDVKPEEKRELTRKEKFNNWWYYHWWHVLIGVGLAAIVLYCVVDVVQKNLHQPDYQIAYVGGMTLPDDTVAALEAALGELGEDCNGDGRVSVQINQYIQRGGQATTAGMYSVMAEQVAMESDLQYCESYFFLLEDPDRFQQNYQCLRLLDGSLPEDGATDGMACSLLWSDCPVLAGLELGDYTDTNYGATLTGSSQELLGQFYIARRGFWTERTSNYSDQSDALWEIITQGAQQSY